MGVRSLARGWLFLRDSRQRKVRARNRGKSKLPTRMIERVVETDKDVIVTNLSEHCRFLERRQRLSMNVGNQHERSVAARPMHEILERMHTG